MTTPSRRRALVELVIAGALWGFGFVATAWALKVYKPTELLLWRFLIATAAGEIAWRFMNRGRLTPSSIPDLRLALPAGLLLLSLLLPQTIGLLTTTASKSGFLTTTYVVIVPLLARFVLGHRPPRAVYIFALAALAGAFLLMDADLGHLVPGDLWTLLCAFMGAIHILFIERISPRIRDSFRFNNFQSLWCAVGLLPLLLVQDNVTFKTDDVLAIVGLLSLAVGSSTIGFAVQIRAQKVLSASVASQLFLLEAPFALIFGVIFLSETFTVPQACGAILILMAAALTVKSDSLSHSK